MDYFKLEDDPKLIKTPTSKFYESESYYEVSDEILDEESNSYESYYEALIVFEEGYWGIHENIHTYLKSEN